MKWTYIPIFYVPISTMLHSHCKQSSKNNGYFKINVSYLDLKSDVSCFYLNFGFMLSLRKLSY